MDNTNPWIKRFERERAARKEAEKLLEDKSLELYNANLSLEKKVQERTKELKLALEEAHVAQKAKDAFFSSMSHELRTPLNAIIGFSQILSKQENVPEKILSFVQKINIAGNTLLKLINTILNFSKIESDNMQINKEEIQAKSFVDDLLLLIETQAHAKNITLKADVKTVAFMADKQLMHQAILNILSNAVKFTHQGGKISIKGTSLDGRFILSICDDGVGISEENQEKLFKPFAQVHNEYQAKVDGTGLGLYLTLKIVQLHGGELTLQSKLGQGSCFTIRI
ncbi:MAG: HAMP domain-containing sensor histidine kinase [Sulfurimonas sp.]|nr:HAMP domain-containing sensor histidine kinase [Sulfurimonas sp.]